MHIMAAVAVMGVLFDYRAVYYNTGFRRVDVPTKLYVHVSAGCCTE